MTTSNTVQDCVLQSVTQSHSSQSHCSYHRVIDDGAGKLEKLDRPFFPFLICFDDGEYFRLAFNFCSDLYLVQGHF